MKVAAVWSDDCQGKKDYDGDILHLSSRYWPAGGGFWMVTPGKGLDTNPAPEIKPSASSTILLRYGDPEVGKYIELARMECEGDSEAEVKAKVEQWAQAKYEEIVAVLKERFAAEQNIKESK